MSASIKGLVSIAALLWMSIIGGNSRIIEGPVDTEVRVSDSTYFNCSISNSSAPISWLHYPMGMGAGIYGYVYINGQLHAPYDKRFRVEKVTSNGSFHFNLVVTNAEHSDAGLYVCQNGGTNLIVSAQLIIIESDPVCSANINSIGFIGPNSCGLNKDAVFSTCGVSYTGNIPPKVQWTLVRNGSVHPVPDSQWSCSDSGSQVVCNYTALSDIEMNGSYLVCQTSRSRNSQYYCKTDTIIIHYAIRDRVPIQRNIGDVVVYSARVSPMTCSYTWIWSDGNSDETISENEVLTITKTGWHRCQVNCHINQHQCNFDAITVWANNPTESSMVAMVVAAMVAFVCCIVFALIIALVLYRKHKKTKASTLDNPEAPTTPPTKNDDNNYGIQEPLLTEQNGNNSLHEPPPDNYDGVMVMIDGLTVDPIPIEEAVKEELSCISNCMLVGHNRPFLSILLTFKTEMDPVTSEPLDRLTPEAIEWIKSVGGSAMTVSEIDKKKSKSLMKAIKEGIDRVNSKETNHRHDIKKSAILPKDFSKQDREFDATMKLNRSQIAQNYQSTINSIYGNTEKDSSVEF